MNCTRPVFILLLTCLLAFPGKIIFAQNEGTGITLNGYVTDKRTGETLQGASVYLESTGKGTTSNSYGYYVLHVPKGSQRISASYVGYETATFTINAETSQDYNIELQPSEAATTQVTVIGTRRNNNVLSAQMGRTDLGIEQIKQVPAFLGEVDPMKTLQLLPGVRNAGEGNTGFYVRGGGPDQNLIVLDDAVVYNTGHLFGFFSVFNGDAIKNVSLIKGGMPAQYGGRLSSVVEVSMKDGNNKEMHGTGGIGTIASRLALEGPIQQEKSSFLIAARRTYIDALIKPFMNKTSNLYGSGYYFYDVNAKANFELGSKDKLFLSGYFGRDVFTFKNRERAFNTDIPWGNSTATIRWNHVFSRKLFANTTLVYNDYKFDFSASQDDFQFVVSSGIRDLNGKIDFDYFARQNHRLKFGAQYTYHTFLPNQLSGSQGDVVFSPNSAFKKHAREVGIYIQDDWDVSEVIKLNYGIRYSGFQQVGPFTHFDKDEFGNRTDSTIYTKGQGIKWYGGWEPRFTARIKTGAESSLKFNLTRNLQYIHLATNSGTTLPTDLWVPSTYLVEPQKGWQYAAGYFKNWNSNMWEASVEAYYKTMENQIEYREGYTPGLNDPEEDFIFGKGWSYGAEFFVNKAKGRFTGWIGYTLSWTWRQFDGLNDGEKFPAKYDRRHDMSIVGNYRINDRWSAGGVFVFGTGNAATYPERFYIIDGVLTQEFSNINSYRLPAYHRMDLSATYTPQPKKIRRIKSEWVFSIYNVYSRQNPYFIYFDQEGSPREGTQQVKALQVSLFPILPAVTWNFKF